MTPKQEAVRAKRVYVAEQHLIKVVRKWFITAYSDESAAIKVRDAILRLEKAEEND